MNRRRFLELLGMAAAGTGIVYSFPSVIVPKNIAEVNSISEVSSLAISDWVNFYHQQLMRSKDWYSATLPLWDVSHGSHVFKRTARLQLP